MTKKKIAITIIIMLVLILAYFFGLNLFQPSVSQIHADGIETITLVSGANQSAYRCSPDQVKAFVDAFNQARHYRSDVGTTPPARADVAFKDGTRMTVWGYNQGFATLKATSGIQQNIRGKDLQEWFVKVMPPSLPVIA